MNGMISCSLINSPTPVYEDTCSFTCNTGYELTGNESSDTRTCQSNGSWSGPDALCRRGKILLHELSGNCIFLVTVCHVYMKHIQMYIILPGIPMYLKDHYIR